MIIKIIPHKLHGEVQAIPSKSYVHRVLIAQKLAEIQSGTRLNMDVPIISEDLEATRNCLAQLDKDRPYLDCNESGSTLRFLMPVAAVLKDESTFIGKGRLPERPISPLKEEMERHGCKIFRGKSTDTKYQEICTITGRLEYGHYSLPGNLSSQFITGLLFALPILNGNSSVRLTSTLESAAYVDMTIHVLTQFGIHIETTVNDYGYFEYFIPGNQTYVAPETIEIEGDWSNAAFWLACKSLGSDVTISGLNPHSCQGDKAMLDKLVTMGYPPKGANISVAQTPDIVPPLALVMSVAEGSSMITNAERLKYKESNRLISTFDTLHTLGADVSYGGAGLSFTGVPHLKGGTVDSYGDHRIAMMAAIASCVCEEPVIIHNAEAVKKSYPHFFDDFVSLGGEIYEVNPVRKAGE